MLISKTLGSLGANSPTISKSVPRPNHPSPIDGPVLQNLVSGSGQMPTGLDTMISERSLKVPSGIIGRP